MHVPLDVEDTVAETRLQLGGYRTVTLVDLYLVLLIDIAQCIVAWDGVAAIGELILVDVLLRDIDRLFAVECFWYDEEILLGHVFFLLLANEGYVFTPARHILLILDHPYL